VQPPPLDGVNAPPLFEPKTENFFSTFFEEHFGHETRAAAETTSFSKACPQRQQQYSKIGTGASA
jgi:hypothetical protein